MARFLLTAHGWWSRGHESVPSVWADPKAWFAQVPPQTLGLAYTGAPTHTHTLNFIQLSLDLAPCSHDCSFRLSFLDFCLLPRLHGLFSHFTIVRAIGISPANHRKTRMGQRGSSEVERVLSVHRAFHSVYCTSHLYQNKRINNNKAPAKQFN